jgi:DNA-directed RNA polymerase subunit alpha
MQHMDFYLQTAKETAHEGVFVLEPLPYSFGHSMGNAIRRTLLSSITGYAITQVRIKQVPHMFSPIVSLKESALELILNLKQLRFIAAEGDMFSVSISKKGVGKVTGADVKGDIQVSNVDLYLGEITSKEGSLDVEIIVEKGIGYTPSEEIVKQGNDFITVDAFFSPVKKVVYTVEEARVGRKANADKLTLTVETDGTVLPSKAVMQALEYIRDVAVVLLNNSEPTESKAVIDTKKAAAQSDKKLEEIIIDELDLPSRVTNALLREKIETVKDLLLVKKDILANMKGLGKKSVVLIEDELKKLNLSLID